MIVKSIRLRNFRSILDETLHCERLTALVGTNGSGKSSFLRGLELFFAGSPKLAAEDFYGGDVTDGIEIQITFTGLTNEEAERFSTYLENGDLTVERLLSLVDGKVSARYHGSSLQCKEFRKVREAKTATARKAAYEALRQVPKYAELPPWKKQDEALSALRQWEAGHPEECASSRDDGLFFGFAEVAQGYLGRHTRFISLPAVRDAAEDASDMRGSPVTQIMDLVVRGALANRTEFQQLQDETNQRYREIVDPSKLEELGNLETVLTETLRTYVPDAGIALNWIDGGGVDIPLPRAEVKLVEDSYRCTVDRTGHGLQRTFILTMLQYLAIVQKAARQKASDPAGGAEEAGEGSEPTRPSLILSIEEPEMYQHPNRQRHLASVLHQLATGAIPGTSSSVQVIYATHSPFFVGIDRIDQLRLLRKVEGRRGRPKMTRVWSTTLDQVAEAIWEARGRPATEFTGESLRARLQTVMTPWANEGFFADVVVLVEGEEDRAAVLGTAASMDLDLESEGISIIPVMGKNNLDRPAVIFEKLGVPTYLVWDNDRGKDADPSANRCLLSLLGQSVEDWPARVDDRFACFEGNLQATMERELGDDFFRRLLHDAQWELGINRKEQAQKNPTVIKQIIDSARAQGKSSTTIERIIDRIRDLSRARKGG